MDMWGIGHDKAPVIHIQKSECVDAFLMYHFLKPYHKFIIFVFIAFLYSFLLIISFIVFFIAL